MRYSLADLEKRFAGRPNARWSSIHAELKRNETAEALREQIRIMDIERKVQEEENEVNRAAVTIADAVVSDMPRPSYFDRLMKWFR